MTPGLRLAANRALPALTALGLIAGCAQPAPPPPQPPAVGVQTAEQRDVTNVADFTGNTDAVESVAIRARVQGFLDTIVTLAGGQNACRGVAVPFPVLSLEAILWMEPQVIIDLVHPGSAAGLDRQTIAQDWRPVTEMGAVGEPRVYVMDDDFAFIPGPRFILLVEKLARLLHPEVDWRERD